MPHYQDFLQDNYDNGITDMKNSLKWFRENNIPAYKIIVNKLYAYTICLWKIYPGIIYKDDEIKKSIDIDANMGLNFINYDLSVDTKKKSTTDNGIAYLKKGDYRIVIIQGENSSEEKLIIN